MTIKKEFWELIKKGKKNIELRKVSKLKKLLGYIKWERFEWVYVNEINDLGRFNISLYIDVDKQFLYEKKIGTITIGGYDIIKKELLFNLLNQIIDDVNENYDSESIYSLDENIDTALEEINFNQISINKFPSWIFRNINWLIEIFENNDGESFWEDIRINPFIEEYFKDEEEILVLKIENWSE